MQTDRKVNILLVDDQPQKLLAYEVILAELGENLLKASSGNEALRHLLHTDVAVVLMDVCMPDLDGFELARMIREHPRLERTAIILVSAVYMSDLDRLKGYHSGAVDYVPVPIIPEVLRAKVRVFADLYRKTEQLRELNTGLERRVDERTAELEASTANLRRSEEHLRFLAETIPSMVWIAAPDGAITYANRRWLEYCGLEAEPLDGGWPWLDVHPEDRERWDAQWTENRVLGQRFEIEVRHRRPDGSCRWFLTRAVPRRDADGHVASWFGVTTDIHDQKQLEEQLRDADRRKDEFLAVLAHELRNPLAPIRNAVHIMRLQGRDPDVAWCREVIERQTEHLTRLVDDLLDVSRITSGKVQLQQGHVELTSIISRAVETNRPLIEARGHTLVVEWPDRPLTVHGDLMRLAQVVGNLINNAAKYTPDGGHILVRVERDDGHATPQAVIRVVDTGSGIPPAMLPRVFELFTQVDRTLDQAQGGLGIGLALVRNLVELHGGSVEAHSRGSGLGSEFVVRLPVLVETAETTPPRREQENGSIQTASRLVLVVDDNADAAASLAILLRCAGHQVHTAFDGLAAMQAAERLQPDVVLLDLGMPRMNGYDTAREIRRQPWGKHVLLVAQTGWGQEEDRRRTAEAGFDLHLTKPIDCDALLRLLATSAKRSETPTPGSEAAAR